MGLASVGFGASGPFGNPMSPVNPMNKFNPSSPWYSPQHSDSSTNVEAPLPQTAEEKAKEMNIVFYVVGGALIIMGVIFLIINRSIQKDRRGGDYNWH